MRSRVLVFTAVFAGVLFGQSNEEVPERGVARVSLINGEVSVKRGDSGDLVAATLNAPLVVQDLLVTGPSSRAEMQFDHANFLRVDQMTEVRLSELSYRRYQVQLARGTANFNILRQYESEVDVNTPLVSVRPIRRGAYRVAVRDDGQTEVTVRNGEAEVYTQRGMQRLRPGSTMLVRGNPQDPEFQVIREIAGDSWDAWNVQRDRTIERSSSYRYAPQGVYGVEELDAYGRWTDVDGYGSVWVPAVASGWAPYRAGRWSWVDYWGWTWISADPWGWAPYHYGRWFYRQQLGWCWWPGRFGGRHFYSPAVVGFVGFGVGGFSVGVGFGNVGWFPLAPHEPFYPWWGRRYYGGFGNRTYIDNSVRVVNNINVTNVYQNTRIVGGVTGLDGDGFRRGRPGSPIDLNRSEFHNANLVQGQLPLAPGQDSLRFADRQTRESAVPRTLDNQRFFERRQPTAVARVPFQEQQRGMEQAVSRVMPADRGRSPEGFQGGGFQGGGVRSGGEMAQQTTPPNQGGWRRFGEPSRSGNTGNVRVNPDGGGGSQQVSPERGSGWRRFGDPADARSGNGGSRGGLSTGRQDRTFGDSAPRERSGDMPADRSGSWRRFEGSQRSQPDASDRQYGFGGGGMARPRDDGDRGYGGSTPGGGISRERSDRYTQPMDRGVTREFVQPRGSDSRSWPGFGGIPWERNYGGGGRSESLRLEPPVIRERGSYGGGERGSYGGSGGAGRGSFGGNSGGNPSGGSGGAPRGDRGGSRGGRDR